MLTARGNPPLLHPWHLPDRFKAFGHKAGCLGVYAAALFSFRRSLLSFLFVLAII